MVRKFFDLPIVDLKANVVSLSPPALLINEGKKCKAFLSPTNHETWSLSHGLMCSY